MLSGERERQVSQVDGISKLERSSDLLMIWTRLVPAVLFVPDTSLANHLSPKPVWFSGWWGVYSAVGTGEYVVTRYAAQHKSTLSAQELQLR
jgi:hypothetical protein